VTDRLERLINLVIALRETRRPLPAAEIRSRVAGYGQDDPESFRRMFERDKADLRALGVPLDTAPLDRWDDRVGYRIDPRRYDLPAVRLESGELAALAVALEATGLADDAAAGLRKLAVDAGEPDAARAATGPPVGIALDAPHRAALMEAQLTRTTVRFTYRVPGQPPARRTVDPHALVHRSGRWYVVGHDHDRGARRAFRLDRIAGAVGVVGAPGAFVPPDADVGVDDVVPPAPDVAPETAEVLAAASVAWQVARRARGGGEPAHPGWTAYTVAVGDPDRFVGWVLDLGVDVEVVAPPVLRERIVAHLRAVVRQAGG
jgi:proteasome accessory factor B